MSLLIDAAVQCTRCWDLVQVRMSIEPGPCKGCGGDHPYYDLIDSDRALVIAWARCHQGPLDLRLPRRQNPWFAVLIITPAPPEEPT